MTSAPRVLFLSQRFLFPMDTGGKIRTGKILEQLSRRWRICVVGNYEEERDAPFRAQMEALCERYVAVPWREPRRGSARWALRTFRRSLSSCPVSVLNDTSAALSGAVAHELASGGYDLFVCDFLQSTRNVPSPLPCPAMLFTHNVESRIARRHEESAKSPLWRVFWRRQRRLMESYEGEAAGRYDRVIAVSESDKAEFEQRFGLTRVRTIPTGVDTDFFRPGAARPRPGSIVFCGSMDWLPNQDGVRWFLAEVFPKVLREHPEATLTVVGRSPPARLVAELGREKAVTFTGRVEDVRPHVQGALCYVVPLRIGGGTRIKIYEALAMEKALVSTRVGAEGLPLKPEEHFLEADDPDAFAAAVVRLLRDPEAAQAMGARARAYVADHFSWARVAEAFDAIAQELL